jgi:hypothetical protein
VLRRPCSEERNDPPGRIGQTGKSLPSRERLPSSEKPNDPPNSLPQMYFSSKAPDYPSLPVAVKWLPGPCFGPSRVDQFASADEFVDFLPNGAKRLHKDLLGPVVKSSHALDSNAVKLAKRLGGTPQARFQQLDGSYEFDAISDTVIAQTKPSNFTGGSSWRNQAKITFEIAAQTGRRTYFHFEGMPKKTVFKELFAYSKRYKVPMDIDISPLD